MNLGDLTAVPDGPDNTTVVFVFSVMVVKVVIVTIAKKDEHGSKMLPLFDSTLSVIAME